MLTTPVRHAPAHALPRRRALAVVATVWFLALVVRPVPYLLAVLTRPDMDTLLSGPTRVAVVVLTIAAVLASMWWGDALAVEARRSLAIWSVVVAVGVTTVWGVVLHLVWQSRATDLNPEAAWALLGLAVLMTLIAESVAISVGYLLGPRIRAAIEDARTITID